jgi:hypothetical protein
LLDDGNYAKIVKQYRYTCILWHYANVLRSGDSDSVIRPYQLGDIFLLQRLSRQATHLPCAHTFLQPNSGLSIALSAVFPWSTIKASTYVLRQEGHGLVHEGFLQVKRGPNPREAEVLCLAPSLDAPSGHPAIWNKLLLHLIHEASALGLDRVYADVSDQPLLVNTFAAVGFEAYCRQTVWRCFEPQGAITQQNDRLLAQPRSTVDDWDLMRLYLATMPERVRNAEGTGDESGGSASLVENLRPSQGVIYVIRSSDELVGAFQLLRGQHSSWLRIWVDTLQPDTRRLRLLFEQALHVVVKNQYSAPLYFASSDFQGGLDAILEELGFAPFHDRVRMVKHVVKWVRESASSPVPVVETTGEIVPTSFAPPKAAIPSAAIPSAAIPLAATPSVYPFTSVDSGNVV